MANLSATRRKKTAEAAELQLSGLAAELANGLEQARAREDEWSLQDLARGVGVSSSAIVALKRGELLKKADPAAKPESKKAKIGRAETLVRMTLFVNQRLGTSLDINEVLKSFDLDPNDHDVSGAITNVKGQRAASAVSTDAVLKQIGLNKGAVRVGVLRWAPFFAVDEEITSSWAWQYAKRLVGSINPIDWNPVPHVPKSIAEAVDTLGSGASKFDLVFGVYDTPYRRLKGTDFLHLPGLGIPLSAVHDDSKPVSWPALISPSGITGEQPRVLVLTGEVGHLFLLGPCQFPRQNVLAIDDHENVESMVEQYLVQRKAYPEQPILFVADRTMCRRFLGEAKEKWGADPNAKDIVGRLTFLRPADSESAGTKMVPVYRLGFAVRGDAARWLELLRDSQTNDLFRNAVGQTASAYAELMSRSADLELLSLEPDIPSHLAREFARLCLVDLERRLKEPGLSEVRSSNIEAHIPKIRSIWLGEKPSTDTTKRT